MHDRLVLKSIVVAIIVMGMILAMLLCVGVPWAQAAQEGGAYDGFSSAA